MTTSKYLMFRGAVYHRVPTAALPQDVYLAARMMALGFLNNLVERIERHPEQAESRLNNAALMAAHRTLVRRTWIGDEDAWVLFDQEGRLESDFVYFARTKQWYDNDSSEVTDEYRMRSSSQDEPDPLTAIAQVVSYAHPASLEDLANRYPEIVRRMEQALSRNLLRSAVTPERNM